MFEPWIGDLWGRPENLLGGMRLVVLGESHHCDKRPIGSLAPEMTRDVVGAYVNGSLDRGSKRFFTKVAKLVARKPIEQVTQAEMIAIWNSVIFYNYVPRIAANGPGQRPPRELWYGDAPNLFMELIKKREVEAILVCGDDLWNHLPPGLEGAPSYILNSADRRTRMYPITGPYQAVAAHMHHPSTGGGWAYARWRPVVDFLFAEVSRQRAVQGTAPAFPASVLAVG
jgi:hypothetical protein